MTYEEHVKSLVGTTVKTRDGQDAKIIDVDFTQAESAVIAARVGNIAHTYYKNGRLVADEQATNDLVLPPMPRERKVHKVWIHEDGGLLLRNVFGFPETLTDFTITVERNPDTGKWEQVK